jgi:hypothetical protein
VKNYARILIRNAFRKLRQLLQPEISNLKFLLGQSSILSSRALSQNFNFLWDAEVKVYSQWGEDGILDYICETVGTSKPNVVEIGAGNFIECNSRFLAEFRGANVLLVDTRKDLTITAMNSSIYWKSQIIPHIEWVTPNNVNDIISIGKKEFGKIDILSIDLDGNDYWVLKSANLSDIDVLVVEYNAIFGSVRAVTIPRNDKFDRFSAHFSGLYYGASLRAFVNLLESKGYILLGTNRVGNNAFFIKHNLREKFKIAVPVNLDKFVDWRVRDSRDKDGRLSYLNKNDRVNIIGHLPLLEVPTGKLINLNNL